jgi:hypothetical protein
VVTEVEQALWAFEEQVEGIVGFVKAAGYGLRLAAKRVGDLTAPLGPGGSNPELIRLAEILEPSEDRLSDFVVLALGDHFRAFLARALQLPVPPPLPTDVAELEEIPGTPGALHKASHWVPLLLQLYRVILRGGALDRSALDALGRSEIEIPYPGGKVKLFRSGDHVTLDERHLEEAAHAMLEAARAIKLRILTA